MPRYVIRVSEDWFVDGSIGGCGAERINHSCDPNLRMREVAHRAVFVSRRWIREGEELTWDYRFRRTAPRRPCHCGSAHCRGSMNLK